MEVQFKQRLQANSEKPGTEPGYLSSSLISLKQNRSNVDASKFLEIGTFSSSHRATQVKVQNSTIG